ncbi:hypothetical protein ACFQX6_45040 [Streptosporangium lutulentum]
MVSHARHGQSGGHGSVRRMGHDPGTLFEADIGTLADAFGLK